MPDVTKQRMTAEELRKARIASQQMGDVEFQMDIAPYFDYAGEIDPSIARYHGWEGPGRLNLGGFNVPEDFTDEDIKKAERRYRYEDKDGNIVQIPIERGTVNVVNDQAQPRTWAHEYRHEMGEDGNGEVFNRLADAAVAQNEDDWDSAVDLWQDKINRQRRRGDKVKKSEAERDLIANLRRNANVTPRGVYAADYERGARRPDTEAGWWERDSAEYERERIDKSYWFKRAKELDEFDDWAKELEERNAERRGYELPEEVPEEKRQLSDMTEAEFEKTQAGQHGCCMCGDHFQEPEDVVWNDDGDTAFCTDCVEAYNAIYGTQAQAK